MELRVWPRELVAEYRRAGHWDDRTLAATLGRHARERPTEMALMDADGHGLTWEQYDREATTLAAVFAELGLRRGDAVAVQMPDGPLLHVAYVAAERAGLVVVAIAARSGQREIEHLLARTDAQALVTPHRGRNGPLSETVERVRDHTAWRGRHVTLEPGGQGGPGATIEVDGSVVRPPRDHAGAGPALGADDLFLVNLTSGTTGRPKCVMHTQNRWKYFHGKCAAFGAGDRFLVAVPATGGFGLWMSHFTPLLLGAPALLLERFDADLTIELMERHRITVLVAVPTQLAMLLRSPALDGADLRPLRIAQSGGEHVPYERSVEFERRTGAHVLQFYGSTEAGCVSGPTSSEESEERRLGTAGRCIPEMNVRLFDESGADVTAGGSGRCGCRGPAMSPGYFDDPAANAQLVREDGWMLLGDVVEIDADGYLRVIGRVADFIIRGGLNISAAAVEEALLGHSRVALAAAVGMPDEVMGERVCAYVVTTDGRPLELEELRTHLRTCGVSVSLWPERLECVESLPIAEGAKVAKDALRGDIRARLGAGSDQAPVRREPDAGAVD